MLKTKDSEITIFFVRCTGFWFIAINMLIDSLLVYIPHLLLYLYECLWLKTSFNNYFRPNMTRKDLFELYITLGNIIGILGIQSMQLFLIISFVWSLKLLFFVNRRENCEDLSEFLTRFEKIRRVGLWLYSLIPLLSSPFLAHQLRRYNIFGQDKEYEIYLILGVIVLPLILFSWSISFLRMINGRKLAQAVTEIRNRKCAMFNDLENQKVN